MFCVQLLCCSEDGDVDIAGISADFDTTGASSFCVNDVICEVKNDSVIMKGDADKYCIVIQMSLTVNQVIQVIQMK